MADSDLNQPDSSPQDPNLQLNPEISPDNLKTPTVEHPSPTQETVKPNYLPASDELLAHIEEQRKQRVSAISAANQIPPTQTNDLNTPMQSAVEPISPQAISPEITPPANEAPISNQSTNTNQTPVADSPPTPSTPASSNGNSFSPPPEVINSLTEEQKKFINGSSWGPYFGIYFAVAQNNLKWSLLFTLVPTTTYLATDLLTRLAVQFLPISQGSFGLLLLLMGIIFILPILAAVLSSIILLTIFIRKGRRIAWQSHYWDSFESYQRNMNKWSKWAKRYILLIIILIFIFVGAVVYRAITVSNSTQNLESTTSTSQSSDTPDQAADLNKSRKTQVALVSTALEACYTQKATNTYDHCDSVIALASGKYLSSHASAHSVTIRTNSTKTAAIAYAYLSGDSNSCDEGEGSPAYYVYNSQTGNSIIACGKTPSI